MGRVGRVPDGKGDGIVGHSAHVPHAIRPIVRTAMQSICAVVDLRLVRRVVDRILAFPDAVYVAAGNAVVYGMPRVLGWNGEG